MISPVESSISNRSLSSTPDKIQLVPKAVLSTPEFNNNSVSIYPNPSDGVFNIESNSQNLSFTLFNLQGQILEKGNVKNNQVNFNKFNTGVYFLELIDGANRLVKRIVIK